MFDKVKGQSITQLDKLMNTFLPKVKTNLETGELYSLVLGLPEYTGYEIDSWAVPMSGAYKYMRVNGASVLGIDFDKCIAEMHKRIYG